MNPNDLQVFSETRADLDEAEVIAAECLERCVSALRLSELVAPIPAELWVEHPLGFDFGYESIAPRTPGFETCGYAKLGTNIIRLNESIAGNNSKVRWTTAHEIGHHLLHTKPKHSWTPLLTNEPSWRYRNLWERQADRFAAAFLMPPKLLVRQLFKVCHAFHLNDEETIIELLSDTPHATQLWTEVFVPELAKSFGVSPFGVVYRLADLRLFDGAPILLPKHAFRLGLLQAPQR